MRPKKRILLACADENRMSILKFLLVTNAYAVTEAGSADEAMERLPGRDFDLVLLDWPLAGGERIIDRCHDLEIASLAASRTLDYCPDGCLANVFIRRGLYQSLELLDRVKAAAARKHGPRPMKKPVAAVAEPEAIQEQVCA